ncbi:hypothetical protein D3C81_1948760 [compost metagenome]
MALQGEQGEGVAQGLALQAGGLALEGTGEGLVAVAQVDVITAVDVQGVLRIAHQQAAEHAAQRRLADLAGLGDAVHQGGCLEYGAQGDELFAGLVHGSCTP